MSHKNETNLNVPQEKSEEYIYSSNGTSQINTEENSFFTVNSTIKDNSIIFNENKENDDVDKINSSLEQEDNSISTINAYNSNSKHNHDNIQDDDSTEDSIVAEKIQSRTNEVSRSSTADSSSNDTGYSEEVYDDTAQSKSDQNNIAASSGNNKDIQDDDKPVDPKTLDWDCPSDPDNPHNWPSWKKWLTTMSAAFMCLVVTMGSSLYVSSVPELVARYGIDQTLGLAGLTFYLLGLSTVIGAPLSEVFGRKPIYLVSLPLSCLFTMGVGLSNGHMRIILPLRFFSGVFASPALSIASGTIMDIFDIDQMSVAMTFFCLAPFMGPVLSPIMAGFAAEYQGWRWTQWIQLLASGLIYPFIVIMPETHKGIILRRRAVKRKINLKKFTKQDQKEFLKITMTITVFRPLKMLVVEPIVLVFSVYVAFIFAVLFAFFEAYPVIYRGVYHMDIGISGLPFLGIGIGLWLGSLVYIIIDRKLLFPKAPEGTPNIENPDSLRVEPYRGARDPVTNELLPIIPEQLLLPCKIGSVALPIALFWQAWTARPDVHWMAPIAAGVPFGFGLILIFFSVIMYFSTCYPPLVVASTMAANNMLRYVMSSVFPLFTIQMYEKMKIKWASTLFALICVIMVPIPWIFERWGPKLRHSSQFGYAAMLREQKEATNDKQEEEKEKEEDVNSVNSEESNDSGEEAQEMTLTKISTLRTLETTTSNVDQGIPEHGSLHHSRSHHSHKSFPFEGVKKPLSGNTNHNTPETPNYDELFKNVDEQSERATEHSSRFV